MRPSTLILGLLATMSGCVTDGEEPIDDTDGPVDGKGDGASGTLARTYALELTSSMRLEDTRESDPAKRFSAFELRARAQVTTVQTGEDVRLDVKLCDVRMPVVQGYQPELDPGLIASLPVVPIAGTFAGGRLTTDPAAIVLGAVLTRPVMDALPASGTDPRVRDQDRDGHPGVSIRIPGAGKIYSSLRVLLAVDAPVTSAAAIAGEAELRLDQAIYGDDIWFYDAAASLAESQAAVKVVSATNKFRMKSNVSACAGVPAAFP